MPVIAVDADADDAGFFHGHAGTLNEAAGEELAVGILVVEGEGGAAVPWRIAGEVEAEVHGIVAAAAVAPGANAGAVANGEVAALTEDDGAVWRDV